MKYLSFSKNQQKKERTETRMNFYLSFFDDKEEYQEKQVNNFWLIKHYNGALQQWEVALYSPESYQRYKAHEQLSFSL